MKAIFRNKKAYPLLVILSLFACNSPRFTIISVENDSNFYLDSVVAQLQNYKLSFGVIKPHSLVQKRILKKEVRLNQHDITVQCFIYDKDKNSLDSGFYYSDLSGSLNNEYRIKIKDNRHVTIE